MKDRRIIFQSKTDTSTDTEKGTGRMFVRDWVAGWTTDEDHEEKKVFGRNVELRPSQHGKVRQIDLSNDLSDHFYVYAGPASHLCQNSVRLDSRIP